MSDPYTRKIYLLDPQKLSPETIAVTFAKTSRSPASFGEIAAELSDEKSAQFNEKWVVGYGHASVAEHAVLHIAIENASRLAVESIESSRLASFTEKSTRYQKWDRHAFFTPPELEDHPLKGEFEETNFRLFDFYLECQPALQKQLAREFPQSAQDSDGVYERRLCSSALDVARYLLPAAALANVGMTINARELEHSISKMLSSPLEEVRQIAYGIKKVACASVPTLIKYTAPIEHLVPANIPKQLRDIAGSMGESQEDWLTLVNYNSLGAEKILASLLHRLGNMDYATCLSKVTACSDEQKLDLFKTFINGLGPHDALPREFEHTSYTFDIVLDQGAYYEVKRHRMMTQSPQKLDIHLGYAIPRLFADSGLQDDYQKIMNGVITCWNKLACWNPVVASYIVPNAFNRRVLMTTNVREACQFIKLRTAPNAHFSVRRVAFRMAEEIQKAHPLIAVCFLCKEQATSLEIEQKYFTRTHQT